MPRSLLVPASWALTLGFCVFFGGCSSEKSADRALDQSEYEEGATDDPVAAVDAFDTHEERSPAVSHPGTPGWQPAERQPESAPLSVPRPDNAVTRPGPPTRLESAIPVGPERHALQPAPPIIPHQPVPYRLESSPAVRQPLAKVESVNPLRRKPPPPVESRPPESTLLRIVPRDAVPSSTENIGVRSAETIDRPAEAPAADHVESVPHRHESPINVGVASSQTTAEAKPAEDEGFHRVNVFYGTDRASLSDGQRGQRDYLHWLQWAGIALAGTVGVGLLNLRRSAGRSLKALLVLGVLATCGLSGWATVRWLQYVPLDEQPQMAYGSTRGELKFGTCEVSIPQHHQVGELEAPSLLRVEFQVDPEKHVAVLEADELPENLFYERLRQRVLESTAQQAFVFIHGYNVSFDDAVRRTAQLAFDLKFDGAPICYSWPSQAEYLGYSTDEDNVIWTESDLERFLMGVKSESGAARIHLIAHSMGNRALTSVLRSFSRDLEGGQPLFDEVVLTAPDIDADHFRRNLAPAIVKTANRVTLYASSNDDALAMSKKFHGGHPRAGESGNNIVVLPEIDTIDVSAVDTSLVGHSYFGDNTTVLADMFHVFQHGCGPEERTWLAPQPFQDMRYWVFLAERIGSRPAAEERR